MMPNHSQFPGRVALFFLYDTLEQLAFVRDGLAMLLEQGYTVDIFAAAKTGSKASTPPPGVEIYVRPEAFRVLRSGLPRGLRFIPGGRALFEFLMLNLVNPLARKFSFTPFLQARHRQTPYLCVIGQDPEGLISAAPYAKLLNVPLVYWSFELLFSAEAVAPAKKWLKREEVRANQAAELTLIQDSWRAEALCAENGLDPARLVYLPNAPRGAARRQKSDYLHRRLGIDPARKIILCAGQLGAWTMSLELVQAAASWPEDYLLVMQTYLPRERYWNQPYLQQVLAAADPAHVVFSFDPVPAADYRAMLDSAEVGLAFYHPQTSADSTQGRNVYLMGLSSGKFAGFLYSGLPVVVNTSVLGPKEVVAEWQCGLSVTHPEQIAGALAAIFQNYEFYTANAVRCFNQELELGRHFAPILAWFEKKSKGA